MGFTEAVKTCLSKYATFRGRATRSEYWWFVLFMALAGIAAIVVDMLIFGYNPANPESFGVVNLLVSLALVLPSLAALVRRLHDVDRSGWWYFIVFIPIIGFIVLIVFLVKRGTPGTNRYGPDPFGTDVEGVFN